MNEFTRDHLKDFKYLISQSLRIDPLSKEKTKEYIELEKKIQYIIDNYEQATTTTEENEKILQDMANKLSKSELSNFEFNELFNELESAFYLGYETRKSEDA